MVALPDVADLRNSTAVERQARHALRGQATMKRALHMAVGSACLMAAVGVWGFQPGAGDAAMQLIKLFVSLFMLGFGLVLMSSLDTEETLPEIHVDPVNRQLRVISTDDCGVLRLNGVYGLDSLSRVSLEGNALTAYDADGAQVLSIPLSDAETEQKLREVFPQAA